MTQRGTILKAGLILTGLALLLLILLSMDLSRIISVLAGANLFFLLVAIFLSIAAVLLKSLKWRQFFYKKSKEISVSESMDIFFKGFFLSVITPGRTGDFLRTVYVRKKLGFVFGLASVILDRGLDIAILLFFSLAWLAVFFELFGYWILNPWLLVVFLSLCAIGAFYLLRHAQQGFFRRFFFSIGSAKIYKTGSARLCFPD
jgi:uncharacterized protein (TIRG00374 family)